MSTLRRLRASALSALRRAPFPLAAPHWPNGVARPAPERRVGLDYDHDWSRRYPVRLARAMVLDNVTRPLARAVAPTTVLGMEHLRMAEPPVIIAANHASHVDTPLLLTTLPVEMRHRTVVAAASDYFFDRTWKALLWSFALAAIPIERTRVNRRSADTAAELLEDGWNLVIFPEGGRSPDGWTQPFRGGAAYLARRTGRPVVPVYLHGTRDVLPRRPTCRRPRAGGRPAVRAPRPGAGASCGAPRSLSSSARPSPPLRARTPGGSRRGSRLRWPSSPTRWPPTGGPPAGGPPPAPAPRPAGPRPRRGAGLGRWMRGPRRPRGRRLAGGAGSGRVPSATRAAGADVLADAGLVRAGVIFAAPRK